MSGSQQLVGGGGVALLLLNTVTGPTRKTITDGMFNSSASPKQTAAAHTALVRLGVGALFVAGAALLAGVSSQWGAAMSVMILGLFLLWAMNHFAKGSVG